MAKQQLPDTPWHIGYTKMKESDDRRLNKWCVHYDATICRCSKSGCYMLRCGGSSHCKFYAADEKTSKKIERDNRTQMEIDEENRRKYVESLRPKMQALVDSLDDRRYIAVQYLTRCYICGSKLMEIGKTRKQCTLCHMKYVDQISWFSDTKIADGQFVYVMGREKLVIAPDSPSTERCKFCNDIGRCGDKESPLYKKRCKPEYCQRLKRKMLRVKQVEDYEFIGVKDIPINKIVIRNMSKPRKSKIDCAVESLRRNGRVTKPIYVECCHPNKYLLKDGYSRYLAAIECGLSSIPATREWEYVKETIR